MQTVTNYFSLIRQFLSSNGQGKLIRTNGKTSNEQKKVILPPVSIFQHWFVNVSKMSMSQKTVTLVVYFKQT